ncbi:hypothetical protein BDV18DRAFT_139771 [Aspergillus unguis]
MFRGSYLASVAAFNRPLSSPQLFLSAVGMNATDPQPVLSLCSIIPVPPYWIPRLCNQSSIPEVPKSTTRGKLVTYLILLLSHMYSSRRPPTSRLLTSVPSEPRSELSATSPSTLSGESQPSRTSLTMSSWIGSETRSSSHRWVESGVTPFSLEWSASRRVG